MKQDEDFNFDRELLDEDHDNDLFKTLGILKNPKTLKISTSFLLSRVYTLFGSYFPNQKIF